MDYYPAEALSLIHILNKYYRILDKILATGKTQTNKKGNIQYLSLIHILLPLDGLFPCR